MIRFWKKKNPKVPSFRFCPILNIANSESWEIFLLLQSSTVVVTQELKLTKKNELRQKLKCFDIALEEKKKIIEVSEFSIFLSTKNRKPRNLEKFSFTSNVDCFDCIKHGKV